MSVLSNDLLFKGKKTQVIPNKTGLEAIHMANIEKKQILPNRFYNKLFFEKFKPLPDKIVSAMSKGQHIFLRHAVMELPGFYTGTFGVIGDKGKPFGKRIEAPCGYLETIKTVIVELDEKYRNLVDTLLTCDHLFDQNGKPSLLFSNAKTRELIDTDEKMHEAEKIFLTMRGKISAFEIQDRWGGVFETIGNEKTQIWTQNTSTIGLLRRGSGITPSDRKYHVLLFDLECSHYSVIIEDEKS